MRTTIVGISHAYVYSRSHWRNDERRAGWAENTAQYCLYRQIKWVMNSKRCLFCFIMQRTLYSPQNFTIHSSFKPNGAEILNGEFCFHSIFKQQIQRIKKETTTKRFSIYNWWKKNKKIVFREFPIKVSYILLLKSEIFSRGDAVCWVLPITFVWISSRWTNQLEMNI